MSFAFLQSRMLNRAFLGLLPLLFICESLSAQELPAAGEARVDSMFSYLNKNLSPGISVAIIKDEKIILKKGYGYANLEQLVPITPTTVFDIASLAKPFTGMLVAMLVTEKKIKLTDDIRKYIPEMHPFRKVITIEHLLHHTSGIRDWVGTLRVAGWRADDPVSFNDILKMAYNQTTLNFDPGSEHLYSNTGYNILAEIIQRVTGKSLKQCLEERIFTPLKMRHSRVMDDYNNLIPNRALSYRRNPDGSFRNTLNALSGLGSSSVFSNAVDLAMWLINFDNANVGGKKVVELMKQQGRLDNGTEISYGFGIKGGNYKGLSMITTSGTWASYSAFKVYFPGQRFGIVVLSNSQTVDAQNAVIQIADIYLENYFKPDPIPASSTDVVKAVPAKDDNQRFSGLFKNGQDAYLRFEFINTSLLGQIPGIGSLVVSPESEGTFSVDEDNRVEFISDSHNVTSVVYKNKNYIKVSNEEWKTKVNLDDYTGEFYSKELEITYRVIKKDNHLELTIPRRANISLAAVWPNGFSSQYFNFSLIEFQRNRNRRVTGFVLHGDPRSRNIRFEKRSEAQPR